jgi:hypothetical protein
MNLAKLINPISVTILGVVLTIVAAALIFTLLIKDTMADLSTQTATYQANEQYEGPGPKTAAQQQVTQAQLQVQNFNDQWNQILATKNPDIDYSDRMAAWNEYIDELNYHLGPSVEQWMPTTGIKPTGPITTPAAPSDPNAVVAKNPIIIPLNGGSAITVIGSFPQILRHVEAWNDFNRIVLIDKLNLTGISPFVTGTYTATVYEFPHNGNSPGAAVPSAPGVAGNGGAPGPGGMQGPGGMPPGGPRP